MQYFSPWNLEGPSSVPSFFISFNTLYFTSILFSSVCPWPVCLLTLEYFAMLTYVFKTNMVASYKFLSRPTDWLVLRFLRIKSVNKCFVNKILFFNYEKPSFLYWRTVSMKVELHLSENYKHWFSIFCNVLGSLVCFSEKFPRREANKNDLPSVETIFWENTLTEYI